MSHSKDAQTGVFLGHISAMPLVVAAFGRGASWNAYINLSFMGGGLAFWLVARLAAREADRERGGDQ